MPAWVWLIAGLIVGPLSLCSLLWFSVIPIPDGATRLTRNLPQVVENIVGEPVDNVIEEIVERQEDNPPLWGGPADDGDRQAENPPLWGGPLEIDCDNALFGLLCRDEGGDICIDLPWPWLPLNCDGAAGRDPGIAALDPPPDIDSCSKFVRHQPTTVLSEWVSESNFALNFVGTNFTDFDGEYVVEIGETRRLSCSAEVTSSRNIHASCPFAFEAISDPYNMGAHVFIYSTEDPDCQWGSIVASPTVNDPPPIPPEQDKSGDCPVELTKHHGKIQAEHWPTSSGGLGVSLTSTQKWPDPDANWEIQVYVDGGAGIHQCRWERTWTISCILIDSILISSWDGKTLDYWVDTDPNYSEEEPECYFFRGQTRVLAPVIEGVEDPQDNGDEDDEDGGERTCSEGYHGEWPDCCEPGYTFNSTTERCDQN